MESKRNNKLSRKPKFAAIFFTLFILIPVAALSQEVYEFERMVPVLEQQWYFYNPYGIAADKNGYVYIADSGNDRIQKYTADGEFVTQWGKLGSEPGEFNIPSDIALDTHGFIYVADSQNSRIQKFDTNGKFIAQWGSAGTGSGEFEKLYGIAISQNGDIYVTDTGKKTFRNSLPMGSLSANGAAKAPKPENLTGLTALQLTPKVLCMWRILRITAFRNSPQPENLSSNGEVSAPARGNLTGLWGL
jgi:DNA-binding beta-propeller fold protein YncE